MSNKSGINPTSSQKTHSAFDERAAGALEGLTLGLLKREWWLNDECSKEMSNALIITGVIIGMLAIVALLFGIDRDTGTLFLIIAIFIMTIGHTMQTS